MDETYVDHSVLAAHAANKVNIESEEASKRRNQVNHLRERLEHYIEVNPDFSLVKLRGSGSTAKHTAIRGRGSDADVAVYVRADDVGGLAVEEFTLLEWVCERCRDVYGKTKVAEDFVISEHAVGITMHGSKLKIDVAPVQYEGEPDDRGYLVTRQGDRVLTSVTLHLQFINERKRQVREYYKGTIRPDRLYTELIRLLKAWIREAKQVDEDLRCKSFMLELIVAHLWQTGWRGQTLAVNDYPQAIAQVLAFMANTELREPIGFEDYYEKSEIDTSSDPIQIWDPVNASNNVARTYSDADRKRLVDCAGDALDAVSWAAQADTKSEARSAWRQLFGPGFEVP